MLSHNVFSLAVAWAALARGTHLLPHLRMLTLLMMVAPISSVCVHCVEQLMAAQAAVLLVHGSLVLLIMPLPSRLARVACLF